MKDTIWAVGEDFGNNELVPMKSPTELLSPDARVLQAADKMTVRLRVFANLDDVDSGARYDNDLIIASKFQIGNNTPVMRLHYLKDEVDDKWIDDEFFRDEIYSTEDYNPKTGNVLNIEFIAVDEDRLSKETMNSINSFLQSATNSLAATFPVIAPFSGIGGKMATNISSAINDLVDQDEILRENVKLEIAEPSKGMKLLQPGYFIIFPKPTTAKFVSRNLRVVDEQGNEYEDSSYAIIQVTRDYKPTGEWEVTKKIALLLSELDGSKNTKGMRAWDNLKDTMEGFQRMQELKRYRELKSKVDLSDTEKERLDHLKTVLLGAEIIDE